MTNSNLVAVFNGQIANQPIQLVNARELHQFLESKQDFSNWITNRIEDYGFIENEDYIILQVKTGGRGRARTEYHITLDMGKELGMVERNEKGRQIRRHFIAIEKRAKQKQFALPEPTVNREFKEAMIKILSYAHQYEQFQKSITSSKNENKQKQVEFLFSEIPEGDSYLFVFRKEIAQDIQKASDLLFALNFS
ncbi:antA/AntB antirepressor family protein [Rodentibacter rarus]|uniref:antA/AntB antirepressor family protein n=1 Tax=Rodentibacter rarus TaxID=1908260 RepID=UPI0009843C7D|nr:antA/AntB antirepressor family protein [Rodentibacter rarus]